jgi:hypothetical protein
MQSRSLASRSSRNPPRAQKFKAVERIVHITDSSGVLHVLSQVEIGECWHFSEDASGELSLVGSIGKPEGGPTGAIALVEAPTGRVLAFALGPGGTVCMRRMLKSKWAEWADVGNADVTHLAAVRVQDNVLLIARRRDGRLDGLEVGRAMPESADWFKVATSCAGQPQALIGPRGTVFITYRSDSNQLMELRQTIAADRR